MPKLRYVGLKADGEHAFCEKTGIVWMPGSEHDVSTEHAALMLPHTDVWEIGEPGPTLDDAPARVLVSGRDEFASETDEWVHAFARKNGLKVHHKLAGENLRAKVAELLLAPGRAQG